MMFDKTDLDERFCGVIPAADNARTMREYICSTEAQFGLDHADLDSMDNFELNVHIDFMDYLWTK